MIRFRCRIRIRFRCRIRIRIRIRTMGTVNTAREGQATGTGKASCGC